MQKGTHIPKTRPAGILMLTVILAAVAALSLHTGSATYAQTGSPDGLPAQSLPAPALTATATGPNTIELRWNAVPHAASYRLIVWDEGINDWRDIGGALTGTSHVHGGLTADTTYYFHVRALDADGAMSQWSPRASATTHASAPGASSDTPTPTPTATGSALPAPALTAEGGAGEITLRWDPVPHAASYRLVVWDREIKDWRDIGGLLTGTSYVHGGLTADTTYYFHIRALDADGATSVWSPQASATTHASAPGALTPAPTPTPTHTASSQTSPTDTPTPTSTPTPTPAGSALSAPVLTAEGGAGEIMLRWDPVPQAASYRLVVWDREIKDWRDIGGVLTGTSYTHRGLTAGAIYYFHIRTVDADGATSKWSPQVSAPVSATETPAAAPTPATTEKGALIALYEAMDGANWKRNANWLSDKPLNSWDGVTTDANGRVTALNLDGNRLRGRLPDLSALSILTELTLSHNPNMGGPIPDLSALSKLQKLHLQLNRLTGSIPDLSALSNLTELSLSHNRLSGPIPDLSALSNLTMLGLAANYLSGPIPDLSALSNLESLYLGDNNLSGPIPDLSALSNLEYLYLDINRLTGPIPDLSALSNLRALELSHNQLSGPIPDLSALTGLTRLDLSHNQLSGPVPDLSAHSGLTWLDLSHNQLSGPVPDLGTHTGLTWLDLSHNQLSGTVFALNLLISLKTLDLSHNRLSGPIPDLDSLANLTRLDLAGNRLCLPTGYAQAGANTVVTAHLNRLNPAPCTEAELVGVPGAPQNLAAAIGAGQVTLTWDAVTDAAGYDLWMWNSLDREWEAAGDALTATTYTHAVLGDGRNYYYQVRARNANGVRSPWSQRARAIIVPARFPPPPPSLGLHLYYQKYLAVGKVVVIAPTEVSDEKMEQARATVSGMLSGKAGLLENESGKYIRISIYKKDEEGRLTSQVPEYLNQYPDAPGVAFQIPSGWIAVVPQEDPRCHVFIHEFAHAIHFAIEDQPGGAEFTSRLEALYQAAVAAGLWEGHYTQFNTNEYWAETVRFWFQGRMPDSLLEGPAKLADYDPEAAALIADTFGDAGVPEACQVPPSEEQPDLLYPRQPPLEN